MSCRTRSSRSPCHSIYPCDRFLHVSSGYPVYAPCLTVLELRELVEQIEAADLPKGLLIYMDGPSGPSSAAVMDG
jgi:hypothetical protein